MTWTRARIGQPQIKGRAPRTPAAPCVDPGASGLSITYGWEGAEPYGVDYGGLGLTGLTDSAGAAVTGSVTAVAQDGASGAVPDITVSSANPRTDSDHMRYNPGVSNNGSPTVVLANASACSTFRYTARVTPGQVIDASVWGSVSTVGTGLHHLIEVDYFDSDDSNTGDLTSFDVTVSTTGYQEYTASTTVPSGTFNTPAWMVLSWRFYATGAANRAYDHDDLSLSIA